MNKSTLTLVAAILLPAFAHAGTDAITTSFERDLLYCEATASTVITSGAAAKADPLENEVSALVDSTGDPVLASYYRDLYRAPATFATVEFVRAPDPYMDAISIALWGKTERGSTQIC